VTVDGAAGEGEWDNATYYDLAAAGAGVTGMYYGFDAENLYLRLDGVEPGATYSFYLRGPDALPDNAYTRFEAEGERPMLGFGARRLLEVTFADGAPQAMLFNADGAGGWREAEALEAVALAGDVLELAAPAAVISPAAQSGDKIAMRLIVSRDEATLAIAPPQGPAQVVLPDAPIPNVILDVADPTGDDHGPGSYVYPRDAVFRGGAYDATGLTIGYDDEQVIFRITFRGPVQNDWGAPNGMGIHTVDIYIDVDGPQNGARLLLPGRNAALPADHAWDYAIWAEGWTPGIYRPGEEGPVQVDGALDIVTNAGQRRITISVPRSILPGDPAGWAYAVTVASQEGYPAAGVWRIREVLPVAEQWRIGGAPQDTNHTRLLDVIYPEEGVQEQLLSAYPASQADVGTLGPDDFGQVPVLVVE